MEQKRNLLAVYHVLNDHFGDLRWWPGETQIEIIVGAILTQNTAWRNVEAAIERLKSRDLLEPSKMLQASCETIETLIRPSGYFRIKTQRLKSFLHFLFDQYNGSLENLFKEDIWDLRKALLRVKGIGEETADSISLYAGEKPIFVVDAYTRRILERHTWIDNKVKYGEIQAFFMNHLTPDVYLFKQYHALLVHTGKLFCKKIAKCEGCPLWNFHK